MGRRLNLEEGLGLRASEFGTKILFGGETRSDVLVDFGFANPSMLGLALMAPSSSMI